MKGPADLFMHAPDLHTDPARIHVHPTLQDRRSLQSDKPCVCSTISRSAQKRAGTPRHNSSGKRHYTWGIHGGHFPTPTAHPWASITQNTIHCAARCSTKVPQHLCWSAGPGHSTQVVFISAIYRRNGKIQDFLNAHDDAYGKRPSHHHSALKVFLSSPRQGYSSARVPCNTAHMTAS